MPTVGAFRVQNLWWEKRGPRKERSTACWQQQLEGMWRTELHRRSRSRRSADAGIGGRGARKGSRARVRMENERGGEGFVLPLLATPPTYSRKDGRKNKGPLIIGGNPFPPNGNKTTLNTLVLLLVWVEKISVDHTSFIVEVELTYVGLPLSLREDLWWTHWTSVTWQM